MAQFSTGFPGSTVILKTRIATVVVVIIHSAKHRVIHLFVRLSDLGLWNLQALSGSERARASHGGRSGWMTPQMPRGPWREVWGQQGSAAGGGLSLTGREPWVSSEVLPHLPLEASIP